MFVSVNQFYYFLECLFLGVLAGIIYEIWFFIKLFFRSKTLKNILDFFFFPVLCLLYLKGSEIFYFPNFRTYMFAGVVLGFILYFLSFHKILAKLSELVYNKTISFIWRRKSDSRQKRKARNIRNGSGGNNPIFVGDNSHLSVHFGSSKKK